MSNDLDLYGGGGVAPYSPGQPLQELQPIQPDSWGRTDLDEVRHAPVQSGQTLLFGSPTTMTRQQVQALLGELGGAYMADFAKLGHSSGLVQSTIQFFIDHAMASPRQVRRNHSFNLHDQAGDWLAESYGNYLHGLSGTQAGKQKLLSDSLWWLGELNKKLAGQQQVPTGQGRPPTTGRPDDLDDATYNALYDYNEKMRPRTEGILRDKWGDAYQANRRMVDEYLQSLSDVEKRHFDRFLNNGLHALNDPTVILGLWGQAVGINNIPRGGAALADEINMMHDAMRKNRKQWLSDERMQSRYRELIRIRDGG